MNTSQLAKILGRRGGLARSRSLSSGQKKKIASLAGQGRWLSEKAVPRIKKNFRYLRAVRILRGT